ncbi:hypothetical protein Tco_0071119 [Tanacetum coccineum]
MGWECGKEEEERWEFWSEEKKKDNEKLKYGEEGIEWIGKGCSFGLHMPHLANHVMSVAFGAGDFVGVAMCVRFMSLSYQDGFFLVASAFYN